MMAHAYRTTYLGGRDWEIEIQCEGRWGEVSDIPFSTNKPSLVVHICNSSYIESIGMSIAVRGQPSGQKVRPYLKNN
jgi:hypothetical protein